MNNRYWLFRRHGVFYLQDAQNRQKESLHTRSRREADQIRDACNQAAERPSLGIAMASISTSFANSSIALPRPDPPSGSFTNGGGRKISPW